ncbi:MAG TPA: hypothetical protein VNT54_00125 [Solirubrobacteraceae bacterium]|nr:hypothetical protein [Solirubrobacteraceae bacterium]
MSLLAVVSGVSTQAGAALPRVDIHASQAVGDGVKQSAQMRIRGAGGYRGRIGIELRGSSSLRF